MERNEHYLRRIFYITCDYFRLQTNYDPVKDMIVVDYANNSIAEPSMLPPKFYYFMVDDYKFFFTRCELRLAIQILNI